MPAKHSKRRLRDPEHPCPKCGECWTAALRRAGGLCLNCADEAHPRIKRCLCGRENVPSEFHHLASQRQHPTFGRRLCLDCHAILTQRQVNDWHPSWKTEQHPRRCIVQGLLDLVWLWLQRSHAGWALAEIAKQCAQAAWVLFGTFGLVGWEGWQAA